MVTEWSVPGIFTSWPAASSSLTCGRTTFAAPRRFGSITTSVDRPVTSSTCLATVTPSSTFSKRARPANSVMMGRGQRVPVGQHGAGLHRLIGLDVQRCAVRQLVAFALAAMRVADHDLAGTRDDDQHALAVGDVAHRGVETDDAVALRIDARSHRRTRSRTTDVESAHRQLRARFADGLRRDHADRFADVHQATAAQVTAVALRADAEARAAGQRGAHLDLVDAGCFQHVDQVFVEHGATDDHHLLRLGMQDLDRGDAAQDAITQGLDHFTAFDQRTTVHAVSACRSRFR